MIELNQYFGFKKTPFCKDVDEKNLYHSEEMERLKSILQFSVAKTEVSLIFGAAGAGKSTALRYFLSILSENQYKFFYLTNPKISIQELYRSMLTVMNIKPVWFKSDNKFLIHNTIMQQAEEKKIKFIFILDEAHTLTVDALDALRLLLNFRMDSKTYLHLILVSDHTILRTICQDKLASLKRRVSFKYELLGLKQHEVKDYIGAHLKEAGVIKMLFSDEVIDAMFQYTKGLPGNINTIAQYSLCMAMHKKKDTVDMETLQEALLHYAEPL